MHAVISPKNLAKDFQAGKIEARILRRGRGRVRGWGGTRALGGPNRDRDNYKKFYA
jgi:hypothetical protein